MKKERRQAEEKGTEGAALEAGQEEELEWAAGAGASSGGSCSEGEVEGSGEAGAEAGTAAGARPWPPPAAAEDELQGARRQRRRQRGPQGQRVRPGGARRLPIYHRVDPGKPLAGLQVRRGAARGRKNIFAAYGSRLVLG